MNREEDSAARIAVVSCADTWRRAASARAERRRPADVEPSDRLAGLVDRVRALSPQLVDAWEATALIESLGYSDRRVQAEFGLSDTRLAGEQIFRIADPGRTRPPAAAVVRRRRAGLSPAISCGAAAVGLLLAWVVGVSSAGADDVTLVVAATGTLISWTVLTRALMSEAARPYLPHGAEFGAVLRTQYDRTVVITAAACGLVTAAAGALARGARTDLSHTGHGWSVALIAAVTAAGLAVGLLNALLLVEVRRPWRAAWGAAPAVIVYLACRDAPGLSLVAWPASAVCAAAASTLLVRRRLHRFDYAYAVVCERRPVASRGAAATRLPSLTLRAETR